MLWLCLDLWLVLVLEGPDLHRECPHLFSENFDFRLEPPAPSAARLGRWLATVVGVVDDVGVDRRGVRGVEVASARALEEVLGEWRVVEWGGLEIGRAHV